MMIQRWAWKRVFGVMALGCLVISMTWPRVGARGDETDVEDPYADVPSVETMAKTPQDELNKLLANRKAQEEVLHRQLPSMKRKLLSEVEEAVADAENMILEMTQIKFD